MSERRKKTTIKIDAVAREMRRLYRENGGVLHPPVVVDAAKDPSSALHKFFTWDDTEAAEQYRLQQARQLIARVHVVIPASRGGTTNVRAYHALRSEQSGYRHTRDIMAGPELRESLLSQFASDLERLTERYDCLRSVARAKTLFVAIEEFCGKRKDAG